jgi:hypothetical protein
MIGPGLRGTTPRVEAEEEGYEGEAQNWRRLHGRYTRIELGYHIIFHVHFHLA